MIEILELEVRLDASNNQPVLILKDTTQPRYLPLWIGQPEALAIQLKIDDVEPPRPLTHDLTSSIIQNLGAKLTSVSITDFIDGVFYATIQFANHDAVSARPSDAIALALRSEVPIFVAEEVMQAAGLPIEDLGDTADEETAQEELERFREFLDQINPEDFS